MKTKSRKLFITAAALLCLHAAPALAQQSPSAAAAYVPDVVLEIESPTDEEKSVAQFTTTLLELQLKALKNLTVERKNPTCGARNAEADARAPQVLPEPTPSPSGERQDFYLLRAVLRRGSRAGGEGVMAAEDELVVDYELLKYEQCKPASIIHDAAPFNSKNALQTLSQIGGIIGVTMEEALAPPKTLVDVAEFTGAGGIAPQVKEGLTSNVMFRLIEQPDIRPRDRRRQTSPTLPAEYLLEGALSTGRGKTGVTFDIKRGRGQPSLSNFFVAGPVDRKDADDKTLGEFYGRASAEVVKRINDLRFIAGPLTPEKEQIIRENAAKLMCRGAAANADGCPPGSPERAAALLSRLRDAKKATVEDLELLGDAYAAESVGEFLKAAEVYDEARAAVRADPARAVALSERAGDAWYQARNFGNAATRYERAVKDSADNSLEIPASLYLRLAKSYRFANERVKALDFVIQSLKKLPGPNEPLKEELKALVGQVGGKDRAEAYGLLTGNRGMDAVAALLPSFEAKYAESVLTDALYSLIDTEDDTDALGKYLGEAEKLPLKLMPKDMQTSYTMLKTLWLLGIKLDYEGAITLLEGAAGQDAETDETFLPLLGLAYFEKARRLPPAQGAAVYEKARAVVKKSTEDDEDAVVEFTTLGFINHTLGKDTETREHLEGKLKKDDKNYEAAVALSIVCANYFNDLDCSSKYAKVLQGADKGEHKQVGYLLAAQIEVLKKDYDDADELLATQENDPLKLLPPVSTFYRLWIALALKKEAEAKELAQKWVREMAANRKLALSVAFQWPFDAAVKALDAEPNIPPRRKDLLRQMMAAMSDRKQPFPSPMLYF